MTMIFETMVRRLLQFCFCAGVVSGVCAQPGEHVKIPLNPATWRVDYRYSGDIEADGGKIEAPESRAQLNVPFMRWEIYSVAGNVAMIERQFDDGSSRTTCIAQGLELVRNSKNREIRERKFTGDSKEINAAHFFPELEWITPRHFVREEKKLGQGTHYYRREVLPVADDYTGLSEGEALVCEAWVAVETGQLVAYRELGKEWQFTFLDPPQSRINIPEDFLNAFRKHSFAQ